MTKNLLAFLACSFFYSTSGCAYNGIYFTAEGGISTQNGLPSADSAGANKASTSYAPNSWRVSVGYNHDLAHYFGFGLNIGYGIYANLTYAYADGSKDEVTSKVIEFLTVSTFHMTKKFDLLFKLGGVRQAVAVSGKHTYDGETKICSEVGVGTTYHFTRHLAATLTYAHLMGNGSIKSIDNINATPSVNEAMLGLKYTFSS